MVKEIDFDSGTRLLEVETDSRGRVTLGSEYANKKLRLLIEDRRDIDEFDVYFHRLGLSVTKRGILDIFTQRRVVIDWDVGGMKNPWIFEKVAESRASTDDDRTGSGVRADAKNLYELSDGGGIVAAHFDSSIFRQHNISDRFDPGDVLLLGKVEPGTEIEPVKYPHSSGVSQYMNTLRMVDTIEVHEEQYPELFDNHPRGTIRRWNAKDDLIKEVYEEELGSPKRYYRGEYERGDDE